MAPLAPIVLADFAHRVIQHGNRRQDVPSRTGRQLARSKPARRA